MRITSRVRASLAGISARPKAHLAHVLLPWLQRYIFYCDVQVDNYKIDGL